MSDDARATQRQKPVAPAVLTVGGSDPSGGAGVQADLKTFAALDAYGASVLTLATDCTTEGVDDLHLLPSDFVGGQLERVAADLQPGAVKTGMVFDTEIIERVTVTLDRLGLAPLVVDPVMTTRRGETLLSPDAVEMMRTLVGYATVTTPSRPEAAELAQVDVRSRGDVERAARSIHEQLGPDHVVVTGGHGDGETAADLWLDGEGMRWLEAERQPYAVHGAGDTFSAALTAGLADGRAVAHALRGAKSFVTEAIRHAPDRGRGNRPLAHEKGRKECQPPPPNDLNDINA
jgi:hydroxymethylpyrimidine/phosphomethylpyrimidine kinase